jgi:hypothetical protein
MVLIPVNTWTFDHLLLVPRLYYTVPEWSPRHFRPILKRVAGHLTPS